MARKSIHDARILSNSGLYRKGQNGELFPDVSMTFCKILSRVKTLTPVVFNLSACISHSLLLEYGYHPPPQKTCQCFN